MTRVFCVRLEDFQTVECLADTITEEQDDEGAYVVVCRLGGEVVGQFPGETVKGWWLRPDEAGVV